MFKFYILGLFFLSVLFYSPLFAQPTSTPAPGHEWVLDGSNTYSNGPFTTGGADGNSSIDCGNGANDTTCGTNDTSFGWDIQCTNTPSTVVGTAGANFVQAQAFGNIGTINNLELVAVPCNPGVGGTNPNDNWPGASVETRRIVLTNWDNTNPDSGVANGATEGTVWIPVSASLNFLDDGVGDGTGSGADELKFLVIGGNGGGCSSWDITADYDLSIDAGPYSAIVGTNKKVDEQVNQSLSNVPDAGNGNTYHATDDFIHTSGCGSFQGASWYFPGGTNTGAFGTGYIENFDILSNLIEDGSTFNIDFTSNQSISLNRTNGNSDAKVTMGPGMGGKVELVINYQIWVIQAPLPIDLTSFSATKNRQNEAILHWSTASEVNSDFIVLQRSEQGQNWEDLFQYETKENSFQTKEYTYVDRFPKQQNYYRLKQVDMDRSVYYSRINQLNFEKLTSQINITPNPFKDQLSFNGKNDLWIFYELINQHGQIILKSNKESLGTDNLNPGLYFILFKNEIGNLVNTQKVVKL